MARNIAKAQIGNALTSNAADHIVAVTADLYDENQDRYQSEINSSLQKWGVVSQKITWSRASDGGYDYTISNIQWGWIPQVFIDQVTNCGFIEERSGILRPKFNQTTGYFEVNGLTNIAYDEMLRIWSIGDVFRYYVNGDMYLSTNSNEAVRTLLPTNVSKNVMGSFIRYMWYVETLRISTVSYLQFNNAANLGYMFYNNMLGLKVVQDELRCAASTSFTNTSFSSCYSLEEIKIKNLRSNIWFTECSRLSVASILYMITNAANTSSITITLHATAYARAIADSDIQAALEAHTTITLASA